MVMSLYRTLKSGTLKKRRESSLGPPEKPQQQPQHYSSKEKLNNFVANNTSNTINSITTTAITSVSSNNNSLEMVSRRKILSRSRDNLNLETTFLQDDQDTWHQKDKLFREHIQEVLDKWTQIDDEIWAKVIVFERNRRVAKAYARAPVLTINGSDDGFDGMRIGLCGFDNPMRDQTTEELKRHIGQGAKLKMDESGNILVRRYSKSNIYVKGTGNLPTDETAIGNEIIKSSNQALEFEKVMKIFDMKKFQSNVNRELSRAYPDRRRLETQCMSVLTFVKGENDVLDCPIWILIINVVAMDMLKSKLPPVHRQFDIRNRPRIPVPDEDPYSNCNEIESSGSSGFGASCIYGHIAREQHMMQSHNHPQLRREKPPKLPPRDNRYKHHELHAGAIKPDYDEIDDDEIRVKLVSRNKSDNGKNIQRKFKGDDLYYCGLRAKQTAPKEKLTQKTSRTNEDQQPIYESSKRNLSRILHDPAIKRRSFSHMERHKPFSSLYQLNQINDPRWSLYDRLHHHSYNMMSPGRSYNNNNNNNNILGHSGMWHARSYESGIDSEFIESPYHVYGRLPTPSSQGGSRGYISSKSRFIIGDWE